MRGVLKGVDVEGVGMLRWWECCGGGDAEGDTEGVLVLRKSGCGWGKA